MQRPCVKQHLTNLNHLHRVLGSIQHLTNLDRLHRVLVGIIAGTILPYGMAKASAIWMPPLDLM